MKLERRLANLGYGSRSEVRRLFKRGWVTDATGRPLRSNDLDSGQALHVKGEPMDPRPFLVVLLHKPKGLECSRSAGVPTIYDLLPPRFRARTPVLAPVGRLDKDTTGLLLLTDDGQLLHRLTHPRHHVDKRYILRTARPLEAGLTERFAAGTLLLRSESTPLRPARFEPRSSHEATLWLREGRYHQVRRMLAAVGNHVEALHRDRVGPLELGELPESHWRPLSDDEETLLRHSVGLEPPGR